jgi:predicted DNA binding CopG/RHH family protein
MRPELSGDTKSDVTTFSSLLEKLSVCGAETTLGKAALRQTTETASQEELELGGLSYRAWPARPGLWHGTADRYETYGGPLPETAVQESPAFSGRIRTGSDATSSCKRVKKESAMVRSRSQVVSIRLSEKEMMMLRQRAVESGISISEYVRSCVVEADRLRVQVKQVVADMRLQPKSMGEEEPAPSHISGKSREVSLGIWGRVNAIISLLWPDMLRSVPLHPRM